jgi:pimeloyl-ACP methyl ester carboxylesterase
MIQLWAPDRSPASPSLAFEVTGNGPPLVLLHGLSGSRRWWERNVPVFAERFRTYTVDLPGFGESRRVRWSRLDDTVESLVAWMEREAIANAHVAGHSLGGAVAALLAHRHPERIGRLVLVNAALLQPGTPLVMHAAGVARSIGRATPGLAPMAGRDLLRSSPLSLSLAVTELLRSDWQPKLASIAAPTLVVWGAEDTITPLPLGKRIAAAVPEARLTVLTGAGHSPMWEEAERFNDEVMDFLVREG